MSTDRSIDRRSALQLGAIGIVGAVAGGIGLSRTGLPWRRTPAASPGGTSPGEFSPGDVGDEAREPEVLRSADGVLRVDLTAAPARVEIAGHSVSAMAYNGSVPGPTLRMQPGDRLEVRFTNDLDAPTNLHTHGLVVSPLGNSDNPFLRIDPGESLDYVFELPEDHPTGVFWYHPHLHGSVADQLFAGLYGALIVEPAEPEVPVVRERTLVVSDISFTDSGEIPRVSPHEIMMGREGNFVLVNGQHLPHLAARAGDRERWRVINACTSRYLTLDLPGQDMRLLGIDGGHHSGLASAQGILLAPGNRADLLITMAPGTSEFGSLSYDRGHMMMGRMGGGGLSGAVPLASLTVTGTGAAERPPVPARPAERDLRGQEVSGRRHLAFSQGMGGMGRGTMHEMGFDGRPFDPDRIDQQVAAGAIEEWTISNPTPMDHPFHLHVWPMQVVDRSGVGVEEPHWCDVVNVPAGGRVTVLIDFTPHHGPTVYHCHILDHEDAGVMGIIDVSP